MSTMMTQHNLMDILSAEPVVLSKCQFRKIYDTVAHNGKSSLMEGIIQSGLMSEETLPDMLSERLNIKKIDLADFELAKEAIDLVPVAPAVRKRIDGMLYEAPTPSSMADFTAYIVSRIKVIAQLDIAEKRLPQYVKNVRSFIERLGRISR